MLSICEEELRVLGVRSYVASPSVDRQLNMPSVGGKNRLDAGNLSRSETDAELKLAMEDDFDRNKEIDEFIQKYAANGFKDAPVTTMRHIMPMLVMEVYGGQHACFARKVKGIWKQKPKNWPDGIDFVDPNNKLKTDSGSSSTANKPKKDVLMPMLIHLVTKYMEKSSVDSTVEITAVMPSQVEDVLEEVVPDWDPADELLARIIHKITFLRQSKQINLILLKQLQDAHVVLQRTRVVEICGMGHNWIEDAHAVEMMLDICRKNGNLGLEFLEKLTAITDTWGSFTVQKTSIVNVANAMKRESTGDDIMSSLNVAQRAGLGFQAPLIVFNIEQRHDDGMKPKESLGYVEGQPAKSAQVMECQGAPSGGLSPAVPAVDVVSDLNIDQRGDYGNVILQALSSELRSSGDTSSLLTDIIDYKGTNEKEFFDDLFSGSCLEAYDFEQGGPNMDLDLDFVDDVIREDMAKTAEGTDPAMLDSSYQESSVQSLSSCNVGDVAASLCVPPPSSKHILSFPMFTGNTTSQSDGQFTQSFVYQVQSPLMSSNNSGTTQELMGKNMWQQQTSTINFSQLMHSIPNWPPPQELITTQACQPPGKQGGSLIPLTVEDMDED